MNRFSNLETILTVAHADLLRALDIDAGSRDVLAHLEQVRQNRSTAKILDLERGAAEALSSAGFGQQLYSDPLDQDGGDAETERRLLHVESAIPANNSGTEGDPSVEQNRPAQEIIAALSEQFNVVLRMSNLAKRRAVATKRTFRHGPYHKAQELLAEAAGNIQKIAEGIELRSLGKLEASLILDEIDTQIMSAEDELGHVHTRHGTESTRRVVSRARQSVRSLRGPILRLFNDSDKRSESRIG